MPPPAAASAMPSSVDSTWYRPSEVSSYSLKRPKSQPTWTLDQPWRSGGALSASPSEWMATKRPRIAAARLHEPGRHAVHLELDVDGRVRHGCASSHARSKIPRDRRGRPGGQRSASSTRAQDLKCTDTSGPRPSHGASAV